MRAVLLVTFAGTAERVAVEGTVVIWAFEVFVSAGRLCCGPVAHVLGLLSVVGSSTVAGRIRHVKSIWQRVPRVQLRTSKQAAPAAADAELVICPLRRSCSEEYGHAASINFGLIS